jgi:hypothetical protein
VVTNRVTDGTTVAVTVLVAVGKSVAVPIASGDETVLLAGAQAESKKRVMRK